MTILNVLFVVQNRYSELELLTPPDNGCILPAVTRNSVLDLKDKIRADTGMEVRERPISIHELLHAHEEDRLIEVIGASTPSHFQSIN